MTLFSTVTPQNTYRDWLKVVVKELLQKATNKINKLILKFLTVIYIKSGTKLTCGEVEISQRIYIMSVD